MSERVFILPHPAEERPPDASGSCSWPAASVGHARKFLKSPGRSLTGLQENAASGDLVVWCEYEAPTTVNAIHAAHPGDPSWLHEIDNVTLGSVVAKGRCRRHLNTDPWLWEPGFVWSVCKHLTPQNRLRPDIQTVEAGDIILFGSSQRGRWLLDTVLVAGARPVPFTSTTAQQCGLGRVFSECVLEPLGLFGLPLVLVRGQGYDASATSVPFSFAPALPASPSARFCRPDIARLIGQVRLRHGNLARPTNGRALACGTYPRGNFHLWHELAKLVLEAGLALGVSFEHPWAAESAQSSGPDSQARKVSGAADGGDAHKGAAPDGARSLALLGSVPRG